MTASIDGAHPLSPAEFLSQFWDQTFLDQTFLDQAFLDQAFLDQAFLDQTALDPIPGVDAAALRLPGRVLMVSRAYNPNTPIMLQVIQTELGVLLRRSLPPAPAHTHATSCLRPGTAASSSRV